MELLLNIFYMFSGVAALYFGADYLVKGGVDIARRFGVSSLVIGLTLVACGTSAPELAVSVSAAFDGNPAIALGNVVGSNIANIGLILGICGCILPLGVNKQLLKVDAPLMIAFSIITALLCIVFNGISRIAGIIFVIAAVVYTVWNVLNSRKNPVQEEKIASKYPFLLAIVIVITSLGVLIIGAKVFLLSAIYFARKLNLSDAVIGLTVVALGTSLPELATSIVAVCKGEKDIAIGNVVGSNIFNLIGITGITATVKPIPGSALNMIDFGVMIFISLLLIIFMASGKLLNRIEGAILFLSYVGYTVYLVLCGTAV